MGDVWRSLVVWPLGAALLGVGVTCAASGQEVAGRRTAFVTPQRCGTCHPKQYESYLRSRHVETAAGDSGEQHCARCHDEGMAHVRNRGGRGALIFGYSGEVDSAQKSARCLTCHYRSPDLRMWDLGIHARNGVACSDCHTIHQAFRAKSREQEVCYGCHRRVKVEVNKRSHHPILEGRLECSSCHQPHGTMNRGLLKAVDGQALCYSCHAEKRGPAVWLHPPVEEDCQNCHRPHGSIHEDLLVDRVPQLCRNCHDWSRYPGSPYAATAGSGSGRCSQNHPAIHGSSVPSGGGERLSR